MAEHVCNAKDEELGQEPTLTSRVNAEQGDLSAVRVKTNTLLPLFAHLLSTHTKAEIFIQDLTASH